MSNDDDRSDSQRRSLQGAVKSMPGWKKKLIGLFLVLGLVGGGSQLASGIAGRDAAAETAPQTGPEAVDQPPDGATGFLPADQRRESSENAARTEPETPADVAPPPSRLQQMAPHLTRIGGSFLVALVLGTLARAFVKTAAMVTAAAAGLFFVLTYYNVLDIDTAGIQAEYESAAGWLSAQADRMKDVVLAALPSSTSAAAGFFVGLKR
jgi:uncharacterized membrane protein (Fun14 family)